MPLPRKPRTSAQQDDQAEYVRRFNARAEALDAIGREIRLSGQPMTDDQRRRIAEIDVPTVRGDRR